MEITTENIGDIIFVTLQGVFLDASNANDLKTNIKPLIDATSKMIFNMGNLQFIDSSGIGSILSCLRHLNAKKGELKLCSVSPQVRIILELVRMHRIIEIFNTKEEAVNGFKQE